MSDTAARLALGSILVCAALATLVACESTPPAEEDAATTLDGGGEADGGGGDACVLDRECQDGDWCNGEERCMPGATDADARGCVAAPAPRCGDGYRCIAEDERCEVDCAVELDADGDSRRAIECGGDDCDDHDVNRYPGNVEVCDGAGHDEDCNPETFGFLDADGDGSASSVCCNGSICGDDCNDADSTVNPRAGDVCDGIDNDCSGAADEGCPCSPGDTRECGSAAALARRGVCRPGMQVCVMGVFTSGCVGAIEPGEEVCDGTARDEDCDGTVDEGVRRTYYRDADGDGYGEMGGMTLSACSAPDGWASNAFDCDDTRAPVNPGVPEICNGIDDDCDMATDEGLRRPYFLDADGDGFGADASRTTACTPPTAMHVERGGDCDDTRAAVSPVGVESCNGRDDDCDVAVDEGVLRTWYRDMDGDGVGTAATTMMACTAPAGFVGIAGDCADTDPLRYPGRFDSCNGIDDDCNGAIDPGCACIDGATRVCGATDVGACARGSQLCVGGRWGTECIGEITSTAETCNGVDDDCDGSTDEGVIATGCYVDADGDTYGGGGATTQCRDPSRPSAGFCPAGYWNRAGDCNDSASAVRPGAPELCNGRDEDCTGAPDDGPGMICALGTSRSGTGAYGTCASVAGTYTCSSCTSEIFTPSPPPEICNGLDDDCDGARDEVFACERSAPGYACTTSCGTVGTRSCNAMCTFAGQACTAPEQCNGCDDDGVMGADNGFACAQGSTRACTRMCGTTPVSGTQRCLADCSGWSACTAAEICNGCDDDGDGSVDNGFTCARSSISYCTTACGTAGQQVCNSTCTGYTSSQCTALAESCNFCDDDRDGTWDDDIGVSGPETFTSPLCSAWTFAGTATCPGTAVTLVDSVSDNGSMWTPPQYMGWSRVVVQVGMSRANVGVAGEPGEGFGILITSDPPGPLTGSYLGLPARFGVFVAWEFSPTSPMATTADAILAGQMSASGIRTVARSATVPASLRFDGSTSSTQFLTLEVVYTRTPTTATRGMIDVTVIDGGGVRTSILSGDLGAGADILNPGDRIWTGVTAATSASRDARVDAFIESFSFFGLNVAASSVTVESTCSTRAP